MQQVHPLSSEQRKSELHLKLQALMPQLTQQQSVVSAPTLANLPPSSRSKTNYDYSLCESIDYQRESLSTPLIENSESLYSVDSVKRILTASTSDKLKPSSTNPDLIIRPPMIPVDIKPSNSVVASHVVMSMAPQPLVQECAQPVK